MLNPGPSDQRNASHRTTGLKSARTPRNRGHHAGDAMDSSRHGSRPGRPSSPTVTPLGVHMVIQSVALHLKVSRCSVAAAAGHRRSTWATKGSSVDRSIRERAVETFPQVRIDLDLHPGHSPRHPHRRPRPHDKRERVPTDTATHSAPSTLRSLPQGSRTGAADRGLAVPGAGQPDEQTSPALEDPWAICCGKDAGEEALKHEFALQFIDRSAALLGLCVQPIAH